MQARAEEQAGQPDLALGTLDEAFSLAEEAGDALWQAEILLRSGRILMDLQRPAEALERFLASSQLLAGNPGQERSRRIALGEAAGACADSALQEAAHGNPAAASELVSRGSRYAREAEDATAVARLLLVRAELLGGRERENAVGLLRQALKVFRENADDPGMAASASRLGRLLEKELPSESAALLREAAEASSAMGDDERVGDLLAESAAVARRNGLRSEAHSSLTIGLGEEWAPLSLEAADRLHLTAGHLALEEGKPAAALPAYAAIPGTRGVGGEARWGEGIAKLRLGHPEAAAQVLLVALPKEELPSRALLAATLASLDRAGRSGDGEALRRMLRRLPPEPPATSGEGVAEATAALAALLDLLDGADAPARSCADRLAGSEDPQALYDAAGLYAALGMRSESRLALSRARGLGLDPVLPLLDPSFDRPDR